MSNFQDLRRQAGRLITDPLVPLISRLRLTPDIMTTIGLVVNLVAAVVIGFGHLLWGGLIFLLAGLFDLLDGALAVYIQELEHIRDNLRTRRLQEELERAGAFAGRLRRTGSYGAPI